MDVQLQITHTNSFLLRYVLFFMQLTQTCYKHLFSAGPGLLVGTLHTGTNEVLNAPIVVSKDASLEVTEKPVTDAEKIGEAEITTLHDLSESKLELTKTDEKCVDGLVKDGAVDLTLEPIHVSQSQEAETIEANKAAEEKVEESQTSEIIEEETKDSDVTKTITSVSLIFGQDDDNIKQKVFEKIESEAVKESEVNNDKTELDHEVATEVVKESAIKPTVEGIVEEIKFETIESDLELVPEEVSETDTKVPASIEKEDVGDHIQEFVNKCLVAPERMLVDSSSCNSLDGNWGSVSGSKIEKKTSIGGGDGGDGPRESISRSEDELFSDDVTEF